MDMTHSAISKLPGLTLPFSQVTFPFTVYTLNNVCASALDAHSMARNAKIMVLIVIAI